MTHNERNDAILRRIREQSKKIAASPETARAYLVSKGFYTADGKLTEQYGGPKARSTRAKSAA
ncbi:MAG: hypothetical protein WCO82_06340 [Sphingomonadales bacterium]|jgi:hypothetical protein